MTMISIGNPDPRHLVAAVVIGFIIMLAGTLWYVASPSATGQVVFAIGLVVIAAGYALLYLANRRSSAEEKEILEKDMLDGFYYVLDEDYVESANDAVIIDLTKE